RRADGCQSNRAPPRHTRSRNLGPPGRDRAPQRFAAPRQARPLATPPRRPLRDAATRAQGAGSALIAVTGPLASYERFAHGAGATTYCSSLASGSWRSLTTSVLLPIFTRYSR